MAMGDRQRRRDGVMKRVQLTSGDHGGKSTGGRAKGKNKRPPLSKAERQVQAQRQVETFRQNIRASEQRRKDRQSSGSAPAVELQPQSTDGESASTGERLAYAYGVLLARVSSYGKAMDSGSWETLDEEAVKVAAAAAELETATKMITGAAGIADDPPGG
ncbi:hypothetical protein [Streptomyces arboris]|uniref:Uncharacterized protein n=1 Tax=Streptomyces arboris TaxID=2600619 RepID=A0A5N5ECA1_9ACTN|nr:hypothetical protein [Streptomyces arboris]KAB2587947.1 hypothetical protein F5983_35015 [Streptomyces arboris]